MGIERELYGLRAAAASPGERDRVRSAIRLTQFGPDHRLVAVCDKCKHARLLSMPALRRRFPNARAVSIEARLVCRACGNRKGNRLCLVHAEAADKRPAKRRQAARPDILLIRHIMSNGERLRASCERGGCGHNSELDLVALLRGWGEAATVQEVRRRLRCSACGGKEVAMQRIGKVPDFNVSHAYRWAPVSTPSHDR